MKIVLFCGGQGTRLREQAEDIPKPLTMIGSRPVLLHLMKYYAHFGHKDFILCLGHRGDLIKSFFLNYNECIAKDFVLSNGGGSIDLLGNDIEDWRITFVETGLHSSIGQRLTAVRDHLHGEEVFLANYSDGLSDLCLTDQIDDFMSMEAVASFMSVRDPQSYHIVESDGDGNVSGLTKISDTDLWINAGFFIMRQQIFDYMTNGADLVDGAFCELMREKRLTTYRYEGFWQSMDTFKDKISLNRRHARHDAPWEVWRD